MHLLARVDFVAVRECYPPPQTKGTEVVIVCFFSLVLLHIFSYLDEIGMCKASQVCQRWRMLTDDMENWSVIFEKRWPLFRPVGVVTCWRDLYVKMYDYFVENCLFH